LIEIIANIIIILLSRVDDIPDTEIRSNYIRSKEKFIEIIFDRIYDKNSFCRSKVLGTFERLCENNSITYHNYLKLLTETSKRLKDDKSQVRKRAISLINRIIRNYASIYKTESFLTLDEITNLIKMTNEHTDELSKKIEKIQSAQIEISKKYDDMEATDSNKKSNKKQKNYNSNNYIE
jgi:condensin complex subunit 1